MKTRVFHPDKYTTLIEKRVEVNTAQEQVDFFDILGAAGEEYDENGGYRETWFNHAKAKLATMPVRFWFSELRARITLPPLHRNWYGTLCQIMKAEGFRPTGNYRRNTANESRKGGLEGEWRRA